MDLFIILLFAVLVVWAKTLAAIAAFVSALLWLLDKAADVATIGAFVLAWVMWRASKKPQEGHPAQN